MHETNMEFFTWFFSVAGLLVFVALTGRNIYLGHIKKTEEPEWVMTGLTVFAILVMALHMFVAFPAGEPVDVTPIKDDGVRQLTEAMPDEKPVEVIRAEAKAKVPEELRRQDEGFEKDQEEANAYLKKAMENAQ